MFTCTTYSKKKPSAVRPGECIVYHVGNLAKDRFTEYSNLSRAEAEELDKLANALLSATKRGEGFLTQKKLEDHTYAYLFTRRSFCLLH